MQDKYITKTDINGNTTRLIIDHEKKQVIYNYACPIFSRSDAVTVTKRELQNIRNNYKNLGFMEV